MQPLVTVTGASGNIGRSLVERLLQHGVKPRVVGRNVEKLVPLQAAGATAYVGDIADTAFLVEAFRDVDAVFAMLPEHPDAPDFQADKHRTAAKLIEAIKLARVPRVVALSASDVVPPSGVGPTAANGAFEDMLGSIGGLSVVALRPAYFMENHIGSIPLIQYAGINSSAFHADVALPMIATRDIAAVAAEYLLAPTFAGYTVRELLGPRDYTFSQVTGILGAAIGNPDLPYVQCSYEDFRQALMQAGCSDSTAATIAETPRAFNEGRIRRASRNASNTTPTTLEVFARESFAPAYAVQSYVHS